MTLNLTLLGSKIADYRNELRDSIEDVALATGIDLSRIVKIESGSIEPTGDEILILSDYFRCDYKVFITNEPIPSTSSIQALYRSKNDDFSKEDRRAIRDFIYLCEIEQELSKALGKIPKSFTFTPSGAISNQAVQAASAVRDRLEYQNREFPRNVFDDCRRLGIHVFRRRLHDSNISGLFIVHPNAGNCILVNSCEDIYRQRFSAAHELAHSIFDTGTVASVSLHTERQKPIEQRANEFASAYLMPPELLRQLPNPSNWNDDDAKRWANKFGVSCDAMGIALLNAKLVNYSVSKRIRKLRVPTAEKVDPEIPISLTKTQRKQKTALLELGLSDYYVSLSFDAHREGIISVGCLAEVLLLTPPELREVAILYGRTIHGH